MHWTLVMVIFLQFLASDGVEARPKANGPWDCALALKAFDMIASKVTVKCSQDSDCISQSFKLEDCCGPVWIGGTAGATNSKRFRQLKILDSKVSQLCESPECDCEETCTEAIPKCHNSKCRNKESRPTDQTPGGTIEWCEYMSIATRASINNPPKDPNDLAEVHDDDAVFEAEFNSQRQQDLRDIIGPTYEMNAIDPSNMSAKQVEPPPMQEISNYSQVGTRDLSRTVGVSLGYGTLYREQLGLGIAYVRGVQSMTYAFAGITAKVAPRANKELGNILLAGHLGFVSILSAELIGGIGATKQDVRSIYLGGGGGSLVYFLYCRAVYSVQGQRYSADCGIDMPLWPILYY